MESERVGSGSAISATASGDEGTRSAERKQFSRGWVLRYQSGLE
jgi:hypothetical protein